MSDLTVAAGERAAGPSPRSAVGTPLAERRLTDALRHGARHLYPPGSGRSLFVLTEPAIERGRPDLLIVHASAWGIRTFMNRGLTIPSPSAASAIAVAEPMPDSSLSASHTRRLVQEMTRAGWTAPDARQAADLIHWSVGVEAKLRDWRRAFRQVSHWGRTTHSTAILMPEQQLAHISPEVLRTYDVELLGAADDGWIRRIRIGATNQPSVGARLWVLELIRRQFFS